MGPLRGAFAEGLGDADAPEITEEMLRERVAEARAAWPGVDVPPDAIARALGGLAAEAEPPTMPSSEAARDVCIAVGCAAGDPEAMRAFEARYFSAVERTVGHAAPGAAFEEVLQQLRDRLFVAGPDRTAPVMDYAGRGDLRRFVNVAALRIALNLRRGDKRRRDREERFAIDADALAPALRDPELDFVKGDYRAQFKTAFEEAVAGLEPRQRNVLRAHLVEGLTIDDLGALYGVHRATAARWLAAARAAVAGGTRDRLTVALGDAGKELTSLLDLIRSRLDLSITRVLADDR